jgi:hypothetical protein
MSSVAPTRKDFDKLLSKLNPQAITLLLSCRIEYYPGDEFTSLTPASMMVALFHWILNTVLQLQVCCEHDGITREDAKRFIALFTGRLTPTFEASIVSTNIVGQEIHRLLNHMAFSMRTW